MKTLVIPDIHLRCDTVDRILSALAGRYNQIVLLGDYFDDFGDTPEETLRVAKWLTASIAQPNRFHIVGNHDITYLAPSSFTCCAGWSPEKMRAAAPVLNLLPRDRLFAALEIDGWLLSHAGFAPAFADCRTSAELVEWSDGQLRTLFAGGHPRVFAAGHGRGGREPAGGMTWCDWDTEFAPTPRLHQLVGHSPDRHVRIVGIDAAGCGCQQALPRSSSVRIKRREYDSLNLCLDTALSTVALIDGDTITLIHL